MLHYVRVGLVAGVAAAAVAGTGYQVLAQGGATMPPVNEAGESVPDQSRTSSRCPTGARGARRARSRSTRTASPSGSRSAAGRTRCGTRPRTDVAARPGPELRCVGQTDQELRRGHDDLPARHPRRSRWQRLGDRRPGQLPRRRRAGAAATRRCRRRPAKPMGHQVFKFSPDGKLLMTLGKPGGTSPAAGRPGSSTSRTTSSPTPPARSSSPRATATRRPRRRAHPQVQQGRQVPEEWGKLGNGPRRVQQPHGLAFDSKGRLFVADRGNNRIQIFDQRPSSAGPWYQFSRPSGLYIDKNDMIYAADSESGPVTRARRLAPRHPHRQRPRRQGHGLHSRSVQRGRDLPDGGRQAGDEEGRRLAGLPPARWRPKA